jgi:hypothetical protein
MGGASSTQASSYSYKSLAGDQVTIPIEIAPLQVLRVSQNTKWSRVRQAFRILIASDSRERRAIVTLAYEMIGVLFGRYPKPDFFEQVSQTT